MRLVDADKFLSIMKVLNCNLLNLKDIENYIKIYGTVDPESLRGHGKWVWNNNAIDWSIGGWICNDCGVINKNLPYDKNINPYVWSGSKYCPNCGAKMDLEVR